MKSFYKHFALFSFCFLTAFSVWGQDEVSLQGKLIFGEENEPVSFAQVAIMKPNSKTPIGGGVSDFDGNFNISTSKGTYDILISFVGFKDSLITDFKVEKSLSLGTIKLQEDVKMIEAVVVEANEVKRPVVTTMEGLEIRPDQTISNTGGSALDVLRNTPSVRVNDDGSISIRGSNSTNILIDGRNSALGADLEQIPASAIKSIQVINNPNAKYDASAAGGVLNIKLKKGVGTGKSASAGLTYGTRNRLNANLRGGFSDKKWSISGGYSFRSWPRVGEGFTTRETFDNNELLEQFNNSENNDAEHNFNVSTSLSLGKNKFTYEGLLNIENEDDYSTRQTRISNTASNQILDKYIRANNELEENYTYDNALIYERKYDEKDKELRALVSSSIRDNSESQGIGVFNNAFETAEMNRSADGLERSNTEGLRKTHIFQFDYAQPLLAGKIETGYKSIIRSFDTDFLYEVRNAQTGVFEVNDQTNRFLYEDQVHAGYLIYSREINKLNFALGVRAEQTVVDTKLYTTDERNNQSYLDFFPSVQASYKLSEANTFKFTYSRRIDRPSGRWLNPFRSITDSLNVRVGDPNLQPEYINSFEVGNMFNKGGFSLTTNAFYRYVNNQVDWIVRLEDNVSVRGPQNLTSQQTYGVELIGQVELTKWWSMNASYSFFQVEVDGSNLDDSFTNSGNSWYAKFNSDFSLPKGFDLQITGNYTAPEIEAQGRDLARYYLDLSIQKKFMKGRLTTSLAFRDVFNTRNFRGENFGPNFSQRFRYNRETQIVLATVRYQIFGDKS